ncbi:hypothetical protein [Clostridium sp.]|uniref:hypothetical protein n=1 Tax=Clostridium sp. TaxID=1506 RepID=UPI001B3E4152|nr:hypothetical protein [Clostridium sp.]MBP3917197.1 hypothetical protein [Clostridium sp.]
MKKSLVTKLIIGGVILCILCGLPGCASVSKEEMDDKALELVSKESKLDEYTRTASFDEINNKLSIVLSNDVYESSEINPDELEDLIIEFSKNAEKKLNKMYKENSIDVIVTVIMRGHEFIEVKNGYIEFIDKDAISAYNLDFNEYMGKSNVINEANMIISTNSLLSKLNPSVEYFEADNSLQITVYAEDYQVDNETFKETLLDVDLKIYNKLKGLMNGNTINVIITGTISNGYSIDVINGNINYESEEVLSNDSSINYDNISNSEEFVKQLINNSKELKNVSVSVGHYSDDGTLTIDVIIKDNRAINRKMLNEILLIKRELVKNNYNEDVELNVLCRYIEDGYALELFNNYICNVNDDIKEQLIYLYVNKNSKNLSFEKRFHNIADAYYNDYAFPSGALLKLNTSCDLIEPNIDSKYYNDIERAGKNIKLEGFDVVAEEIDDFLSELGYGTNRYKSVKNAFEITLGNNGTLDINIDYDLFFENAFSSNLNYMTEKDAQCCYEILYSVAFITTNAVLEEVLNDYGTNCNVVVNFISEEQGITMAKFTNGYFYVADDAFYYY